MLFPRREPLLWLFAALLARAGFWWGARGHAARREILHRDAGHESFAALLQPADVPGGGAGGANRGVDVGRLGPHGPGAHSGAQRGPARRLGLLANRGLVGRVADLCAAG